MKFKIWTFFLFIIFSLSLESAEKIEIRDDPYLFEIIITPENPTMQVGESLDFTATGYDQYNDPFPLVDPQWQHDSFHYTISVHPEDPASCTITATSPGNSYIICWEGPPYQGLHGSTDITIVPQQVLGSIVVTPSDVILEIGENEQFSAVGYDTNGNPMNPPITPVWSCDGGTITQEELYTATQEGDYTVTAGAEGTEITGTASVHVDPGSSVEEELCSSTRIILYPNYPNPFNPETKISYHLHKPQSIKILIYNIKGELIEILIDGFYEAGFHSTTWYGYDMYGKRQSSGSYIYQLISEDVNLAAKMVLVE